MAKSVRVTMTAKQCASAYGTRLINLILSMSHDGELTIDEVRVLHNLLINGPETMAAVVFLRELTGTILLDGKLSELEAYQLRRAMERVVPKDTRMRLTELLSRIGLPTTNDDEDEDSEGSGRRPAWHDDPITARQAAYIQDLGGVPDERMTKGQASILIDALLISRPPSPRQQMVLRFFDRLDLMSKTKEEVSVWMDKLYASNPACERAWDKFKIHIGDDRTIRDPSVVPIGEFRKYMRPKTSHRRSGIFAAVGITLFVLLCIVAVVLLVF